MGAGEPADLPDTRARRRREYAWAHLTDEQLLDLRIRDLGLKLDGTALQRFIDQLYSELDIAGLRLHPPCYLSDEWATPEGVPAIAVPFYLAHRRLRRLEMKLILEVEGGTRDEAMRILRHEAGHAINYAYRLYRRKKWREVFGPFEAEYKEAYRIKQFSKKYVHNIENWYAQMHPDEDFAETFAVWMTPRRDWRSEYAGWGALKKLEYVEELMRRDVSVNQPKVVARKRDYIYVADRMKTTLRAYYRKKRHEHARMYPDFYDADLHVLFTGNEAVQTEPAAHFLRRRRQALLDSIARWSREKKYTINGLLRELIERCDELGLRLSRSEDQSLVDVTTYLTVLIENYKYTGEFKDH